VLTAVKETGKKQLEAGQESIGEAPVLSHNSLLSSAWPKSTIVLEHCCEGGTNCWFSIFQGVSFSPHTSGKEGSNFTFLHSQWQILLIIPANSGNFLKPLHIDSCS
jgi:hypothetical protein